MDLIELCLVSPAEILVENRARTNMGDLDSLVESMKTHGIIQPLAVEKLPSGQLRLLAGGRRHAACIKGGFEQVPVRIYLNELTPNMRRAIELQENTQRKELDWPEQVKLQKEIHDAHVEQYGEKIAKSPDAPGWSGRDTASLLGVSASNLSDNMLLAEALQIVPELVEKCSTKQEALALIKSAGKRVDIAERSAVVQEELKTKPQAVIHKKLIDSFIVGDFFDKIKSVPDNFVNLVEVDPPYGIDLGDFVAANSAKIHKGGTGTTQRQAEYAGYNEVDKGTYGEFLDKLLYDCYRVMVDGSWIVLWYAIGDHHATVKASLQKAGFKVAAIPAVWVKENGQTVNPQYVMGSSYEPFFYARKGTVELVRQGQQNNFRYNKIHASKKTHPTERPIELMQDILSIFGKPGDRMLVPFVGSGNSLLAGANLGMEVFGYELKQSYKDSYVLKVTERMPPEYRSYEK